MSFVWPSIAPPEVIADLRGDHELGIFFRVATTPVLRFWFGVGGIPAGYDAIDPGGSVYLGGGQLKGVPTLEALINGASSEVEFTLSGVDVTTGQQLWADRPDARGKEVRIGITTLTEYYQPRSSIRAAWSGTASHFAKSIPTVTGRQPRSMSLILVVAGGNNTRSRAARSLWSPPHHKSLYPTDKFTDETSRLGRGVEPAWPRVR